MKIGTVIDDISPVESLRRGITAERLGFQSLWFSDHLIDTGGIKVDPWTTMGAIGARTSKIEMCCAVSDFQRIHPAKLAHMVATLFDLSNGRTMLGIGAGEAMNIVPFGIGFARPKQRAEQLGEAVQVAKLLWNSNRQNPVSFEGKHFRLDRAWLDVATGDRKPRVIVGALGGKNALGVAGRFGDGWVSWLNSPETFRKKLEIANSAASQAGRKDQSEFRACVWIYTVLTSDESEIRKAMNRAKRGLLAERHTLEMAGLKVSQDSGVEIYQNMLVTDDSSDWIAKAQDTVPDELAMKVVAAGDASKIIEKIEEFGRAGATDALIHFVGTEENQMEEFSSKVLSYFA
jgi:phthiodiolone/phenolphthiodiolone dimycocerosates ketoreductase